MAILILLNRMLHQSKYTTLPVDFLGRIQCGYLVLPKTIIHILLLISFIVIFFVIILIYKDNDVAKVMYAACA
jgi:hypothetical protein